MNRIQQILKQKEELETKLELLRREYRTLIPSCTTKWCYYYNINSPNNCSRRGWVTDCALYQKEKNKNNKTYLPVDY